MQDASEEELLAAAFHAAEIGRTDALHTVLGLGVDADAQRASDGATLLHVAAAHNQVDSVRTLLRTCTKFDGRADSGPYAGRRAVDVASSDAVHQAFVSECLQQIGLGDADKFAALLDGGVNVDDGASMGGGNTLLHWAASFGSAEIVRLLLDRGASPNRRNDDGATPLHDAASNSHASLVKLLLQYGADPALRGEKGYAAGKTPSEVAVSDEVRRAFVTAQHAAPTGGRGSPTKSEERADSGSQSTRSTSVGVTSQASPPLATPPPHRRRLRESLQGTPRAETPLLARSLPLHSLFSPPGMAAGTEWKGRGAGARTAHHMRRPVTVPLAVLWPPPKVCRWQAEAFFLPARVLLITPAGYAADHPAVAALREALTSSVPRNTRHRGGEARVDPRRCSVLDPDDAAQREAARAIAAASASAAVDGAVVLRLQGGAPSPAEGFSLAASGARVTVTAADTSGLLYGAFALAQILRACPVPATAQDPACTAAVLTQGGASRSRWLTRAFFVRDWPTLRLRAHALSASMGTPRASAVMARLPAFARLRVNRLLVPGADSLPAPQLRALAFACAQHGVQLVPTCPSAVLTQSEPSASRLVPAAARDAVSAEAVHERQRRAARRLQRAHYAAWFAQDPDADAAAGKQRLSSAAPGRTRGDSDSVRGSQRGWLAWALGRGDGEEEEEDEDEEGGEEEGEEDGVAPRDQGPRGDDAPAGYGTARGSGARIHASTTFRDAMSTARRLVQTGPAPRGDGFDPSGEGKGDASSPSDPGEPPLPAARAWSRAPLALWTPLPAVYASELPTRKLSAALEGLPAGAWLSTSLPPPPGERPSLALLGAVADRSLAVDIGWATGPLHCWRQLPDPDPDVGVADSGPLVEDPEQESEQEREQEGEPGEEAAAPARPVDAAAGELDLLRYAAALTQALRGKGHGVWADAVAHASRVFALTRAYSDCGIDSCADVTPLASLWTASARVGVRESPPNGNDGDREARNSGDLAIARAAALELLAAAQPLAHVRVRRGHDPAAFLRDLSEAGVRVALCLPSAQEHALPPSISFLREAARHAATLAQHRHLEGLVLCDTGLLPVASAAALVVGAGAMWDPAALDEPSSVGLASGPSGEDVDAASPPHLLATDLPAMLDGAAFGDEECGLGLMLHQLHAAESPTDEFLRCSLPADHTEGGGATTTKRSAHRAGTQHEPAAPSPGGASYSLFSALNVPLSTGWPYAGDRRRGSGASGEQDRAPAPLTEAGRSWLVRALRRFPSLQPAWFRPLWGPTSVLAGPETEAGAEAEIEGEEGDRGPKVSSGEARGACDALLERLHQQQLMVRDAVRSAVAFRMVARKEVQGAEDAETREAIGETQRWARQVQLLGDFVRLRCRAWSLFVTALRAVVEEASAGGGFAPGAAEAARQVVRDMPQQQRSDLGNRLITAVEGFCSLSNVTVEDGAHSYGQLATALDPARRLLKVFLADTPEWDADDLVGRAMLTYAPLQ